MNDRGANSSDLEIARQLSRKLTGAPVGDAPPVAPNRYTRFSASRLSPSPQPSADALAGTADSASPPRDFQNWQEFLQWVIDEGFAMGGFVMDSEGFAIAANGTIDDEQAQGMGVSLMMVFNEADEPDHPGTDADSIAIEYSQFTLTGIRISSSGNYLFTLGLLAAEYLPPGVRNLLRRNAEFNLPHL